MPSWTWTRCGRTDQERWVLVEELVEAVIVHPDRLRVTVAGAPSLNVRCSEVRLRESQAVGVGGPNEPLPDDWRVVVWPAHQGDTLD